ncbi:hypothetical protein ACU5P0_14050 [Pseudomonas plecoglossicida]
MLFITGYGEGTAKAWQGSRTHILYKPFALDDLKQQVERLLSRQRVAP